MLLAVLFFKNDLSIFIKTYVYIQGCKTTKARPLAADLRWCRVDVRRAGGTKHLFRGCCPRNKPFTPACGGSSTVGLIVLTKYLSSLKDPFSVSTKSDFNSSELLPKGDFWRRLPAFFSDQQVSLWFLSTVLEPKYLSHQVLFCFVLFFNERNRKHSNWNRSA